MARLGQLRLSMVVATLLLNFFFSLFFFIPAYLFRTPPVSTVIGVLVFVLIFVLIQFIIGPWMIRRSTKLRYLHPGENPWLERMVKDLSEMSSIPPPKLAIVPEQTTNAFVFGRTARGATLAVHEGLLKELDQREVQGVIGHEFGHLKHKDYAVMTLLSAMPLLLWLIFRLTIQLGVGGSGDREEDGGGGFIFLLLASLFTLSFYIVCLLCLRGFSRRREHYADAYSAYVTRSPRQLGSALTKITYGLSLAPTPFTGTRTLYIGDPFLAKQEFRGILQRKEEYDLDNDGVLNGRELELAMKGEAEYPRDFYIEKGGIRIRIPAKIHRAWKKINMWFSTHPPTYQRLLLLREIEQEMASGRYSDDHIYAYI